MAYCTVTVTGRNCRPIAVLPGPVADPLMLNVAVPGATASKRIAASRPVPDTPVASALREIVMSMRLPLTCWENVTFTPPERRKLPSCTVRTRRKRLSNVSVNVTVDSRWAPVTEIGMLYGPCPTRSTPAGGDTITCATPKPGEVLEGGSLLWPAAAGAAAGAAGGGVEADAGGSAACEACGDSCGGVADWGGGCTTGGGAANGAVGGGFG